MLFSHKELKEKFKDNYAIQKLVEEKALFKVCRGIYSDARNVKYLEVISKKYPNAIFTMDSAFFYHGLTDVIPKKEYLALRRDSTKINHADIEVVYYVSKLFEIGRTTLEVDGVTIAIYDKERMLIELIRNRKSMGFDYYKEIIGNYREKREELDMANMADYIGRFPTEEHLYDVMMREVF